ncbi:MAG: hypothetical protein LBR18_01850 [Tannerella sp.]|jgi:hypothetical protein|nr:hypothetical protein [Tannerella sp.]
MDKKRIQELIDRFFDGQTSNEEEKELYGAFASGDLPEEFGRYKGLFEEFGLLSNGKQRESAFISDNEGVIDLSPSCNQGIRNHGIIWTFTGIAASILLALSIGYFYNKQSDNQYNPYEGSYIIRNGKKITDPKVIRPEIEKTLYVISMQDEIASRMYKKMDERTDLQEIDFEQY